MLADEKQTPIMGLRKSVALERTMTSENNEVIGQVKGILFYQTALTVYHMDKNLWLNSCCMAVLINTLNV